MPMLPSPTARTRSLPLIASPFVLSPFVLAGARDPGRLHLEIGVQQHEIRAIAFGNAAELGIEAQEGARMQRGHPQRVLDRDTEMLDRVAHAARHVEVGTGES